MDKYTLYTIILFLVWVGFPLVWAVVDAVITTWRDSHPDFSLKDNIVRFVWNLVLLDDCEEE